MQKKQQVVFLYGPPGSGKGTQANLLEEHAGFYHFDIGRFLGQILHDPANAEKPDFQEQKRRFDSGELNNPHWVLQQTREKIQELHDQGKSIVLSGSGRTEPEINGSEEGEGLVPFLERLFGAKALLFARVNIDVETSVERNSKRLICAKTRKVVKSADECDGEVTQRELDKPDVIRLRYKRYQTQTIPAIQAVKERGFKVYEVDGERDINQIHEEIVKLLDIDDSNHQ